MSKQINLLGQVRGAPELSARRVLIGIGVMLVASVVYSAFAWFQVTRAEGTVARSNAELIARKGKIKELEQKLAARPKVADIVAQIDALKGQEAESQEIIKLLRGAAGNSEGYSRQLRTLAQISEEGVWLTQLTIDRGRRNFSLGGRSLRNESVLRYAQRVNEQFSAYGLQFGAVEMTVMAEPRPEGATIGAAGSPSPVLSSVAFKLF
ncbi:MAG: hypothetical protein AAB654_09845 [Acidobacteriota bacterium]